MKQTDMPLFAITLIVAASTALAGVLVESSAPSTAFYFETLVPRAVTTAGAVSLPCASAATVTVASPAGKSSTLAAGTGAYTWTPDEGGLWTLSSSKDGTTTFSVRYSSFPGTEGAGTEASPLKIVDFAELSDQVSGGNAGNGTVFALCGGDNLMSLLEMPAGYAIVSLGGGKYMLDSYDPKLAASSVSPEFVADMETAGPNRRGLKPDPWPGIAYTGDGWAFNATAASTLTLTPPGESPDATAKTGTGAVSFVPRKSGTWTATLAYGSTTLTAEIDVRDPGTVLYLR